VTYLAAGSAGTLANVVSGTLGFLIVAGMGLALFFLLRSMNKHLRRVAPGPAWREDVPDPGPATADGATPDQPAGT
jgi:hypothetical protein